MFTPRPSEPHHDIYTRVSSDTLHTLTGQSGCLDPQLSTDIHLATAILLYDSVWQTVDNPNRPSQPVLAHSGQVLKLPPTLESQRIKGMLRASVPRTAYIAWGVRSLMLHTQGVKAGRAPGIAIDEAVMFYHAVKAAELAGDHLTYLPRDNTQ